MALWRQRRRLGDVVGINRRNVELVYAHNRRSDYPLVDDKIRCKALLAARGVPVAPTVCTCEGLFAISRVTATLRERGDFVVKPASGSGGDGILVIRQWTGSSWVTAKGDEITEVDLRQHLANVVFGAFSKQLEDQALVEERIVGHPYYDTLFAGGLCDIRLLFLRRQCLMAMVRVPTAQSAGRANLHQGAVGVAVEVDSGRTTRAWWRGRPIEEHPDSQAALLGQDLPHWARTLEVGQRAAECVPLGYLGVDIVVDKTRGPLVLELNARPGLEIQNVCGRALRPLVEESLA